MLTRAQTNEWQHMHEPERESERECLKERVKASLSLSFFFPEIGFNHLNTTKQRNIYGPFNGDKDFRLWCLCQCWFEISVLGWADTPN